MNEHFRHIEDLATKTLKSIEFNGLPIPVEKIAQKIGLKIVEFDFPDSFSGVLKKDKRVIGVNKRHASVRRRFTIAHEIGHFLLGHEDDSIDGYSDRPMPLEREANTFASHLLIPTHIVTESVKKVGLDLKFLAKQFWVSEQVITIRLLEMNLIR